MNITLKRYFKKILFCGSTSLREYCTEISCTDIPLNLAYNTREKTRKAALVIGMNGNTTTIKDPENPRSEPRKFTFDYSYWSHDGYKERNDGYLEPANAKYADQVTDKLTLQIRV